MNILKRYKSKCSKFEMFKPICVFLLTLQRESDIKLADSHYEKN